MDSLSQQKWSAVIINIKVVFVYRTYRDIINITCNESHNFFQRPCFNSKKMDILFPNRCDNSLFMDFYQKTRPSSLFTSFESWFEILNSTFYEKQSYSTAMKNNKPKTAPQQLYLALGPKIFIPFISITSDNWKCLWSAYLIWRHITCLVEILGLKRVYKRSVWFSIISFSFYKNKLYLNSLIREKILRLVREKILKANSI